MFFHDGQLNHFAERAVGEVGNDFRDQARLGRGFDDQRELRGGLGETDGFFGRGKLCAVDDIAPVDEFGERLRVEAEFFGGDGGEELGAGLVGGVVEFFAGMILAEMLGVGGLEERALVVVEPPGEQRRARVFEIDDGVFVAVKGAVFKGLRGFVRHAGVQEFGGGVDALATEAREDGGGGSSVEAFVVEANPDFHRRHPPGSIARETIRGKGKPIKMDARSRVVKDRDRGMS